MLFYTFENGNFLLIFQKIFREGLKVLNDNKKDHISIFFSYFIIYHLLIFNFLHFQIHISTFKRLQKAPKGIQIPTNRHRAENVCVWNFPQVFLKQQIMWARYFKLSYFSTKPCSVIIYSYRLGETIWMNFTL